MTADVFGRVRLAYFVVESGKLDEWRRFGAEGLGVHVDMEADSLAFRIDERERRLIVRRGPAEDVVALGIEVQDEVFDTVCRRVGKRGIEISEGSRAEALQRGVERFVRFVGPKGQWFELFSHARMSTNPLTMRASGFVTGDAGVGHLAILTREPEAMLTFWNEIFDARVSDTIEETVDGLHLELTFLHINQRHHTVAVGATRGLRMDPFRASIHHLNLQAASLDDVTEAYIRCRGLGYPIANAIGQHPNDRELSFYVTTPSGFDMELGWRPIEIPLDKPWQIGSYRGISLWGHFPESHTLGVRLGRAARGLRSLLRREHTFPAGGRP